MPGLECHGQGLLDEQVGEVYAKHVVACTGTHFHDTVEHFKDRDVERTAAEIEDQELRFRPAFVQPVKPARRPWVR